MTRISAFILTIESIAGRQAAAIDLQQDLQKFSGLESVEIVPAIYWGTDGAATEFLAQHPEIQFTQDYLTRCKQGQLCATLSHIQLWQKLVAIELDGVLVSEDDIYISDREVFQQVLDEIPRQPEVDFLRIHQHRRFRADIADVSEPGLFIADPSRYGFATYYLSRQGARKLLQRFLCVSFNVDMVIPHMEREGSLNCKTVRPLVVEHHAFTGAPEELLERHPKERTAEKLQQAASTVWISPSLYDDRELHGKVSGMVERNAVELSELGYTTLRGVFDQATVESCRQQVLQNLSLCKNTRPSSSALHLAGFHRFPELEGLHTQLATNPVISRFFSHVLGNTNSRTIGLSDITINRSQCWHKDLLRGEFSSFLADQDMCWGENGGGVYKILFYLQTGASLKVIRGSHRVAIPLNSDLASEPDENAPVVAIPVEAGDVVIMDIRMSHRGASEEIYASGKYDHDPRILISTAMGAADRPLTRAMEIGNFHRQMAWMERNP